MVAFTKTNSLSLADNAILFDNVSLLKVDDILIEAPLLYIFSNGNNAMSISFRDKRLKIVFRDKRA